MTNVLSGTTYIPHGQCTMGDPPPVRVPTGIPNTGTHIYPSIVPPSQPPGTAYLKPMLDKLAALEQRQEQMMQLLEQVLFLIPHTVIVGGPVTSPPLGAEAGKTSSDSEAIMRAIRSSSR